MCMHDLWLFSSFRDPPTASVLVAPFDRRFSESVRRWFDSHVTWSIGEPGCASLKRSTLSSYVHNSRWFRAKSNGSDGDQDARGGSDGGPRRSARLLDHSAGS